MRAIGPAILGFVLGLASAAPAFAQDMIVEKRVFEMPSFTTQGGQTIKNVRVGWEAYGKLNAAKDNVILVTHYFSGNSHAAGKYKPDDKAAGYWDYLIGPGKPIDTNKFYVISSDTLVNLSAKDPNVVTTGPASIDPDTGKPYGMSFPVVTIRDFIEVQKALLESQGIAKLHAVVGASMGALQAYEWASVYPDRVKKLVPVIGAAELGAFNIAFADIWAAPIKLDPNWKNGNYYDGEPPTTGLKEALKVVTVHANHWEFFNETWGRAWAEEGKDPAKSMDARYKVQAALDGIAAGRAAVSDANHFLYLIKATQIFSACHCGDLAGGLKKIDAETFVIYSPKDLIFYDDIVRKNAEMIKADGTPVQTAELMGKRGHFDGVASMAQVGDKLRAFLEK